MKTTTRRSGSGSIMVTTASHSNTTNYNAQEEANNTKVALILGGWSPGPLYYLAPFLQHELGYALLQPAIEMPPVTWGWCCRASSLLLLVVYGGIVWLVRIWCRGTSSWWSYAAAVVVAFLGSLVWLRLLVAQAVHASMQYNLQVCRQLINEYNVSLVVGFSWGGALAAEILAADAASPGMGPPSIFRVLPRPAFLLLAPTTAVVANLNLWQPHDAAWRITANAAAGTVVSVVHATADAVFCPHPERWSRDDETNHSNIELALLRDNHVLLRSASERRVKEIVTRLVERQQSDNGGPT
eukprot:scaffold5535_cov180-Amphora_coffeaeformis.AAC.2